MSSSLSIVSAGSTNLKSHRARQMSSLTFDEISAFLETLGSALFLIPFDICLMPGTTGRWYWPSGKLVERGYPSLLITSFTIIILIVIDFCSDVRLKERGINLTQVGKRQLEMEGMSAREVAAKIILLITTIMISRDIHCLQKAIIYRLKSFGSQSPGSGVLRQWPRPDLLRSRQCCKRRWLKNCGT